MTIIWHGQSFFEIRVKKQEGGNNGKEITIAIDPFDESTGLKVPKKEAQILLISHSHPNHSNIKAIEGEPFLIDSPGEYETQNVFIKGIPGYHDNSLGKEKGAITMFKIEAEGIKLAHLSDLGQKELIDDQLDELGKVDILMIPVGGIYTISAKEAGVIISQIEPKIVIPMHYQFPKLKIKLDDLEKFLKVMGKHEIKPQEKLKIKASDFKKEEEEEIELVVLKP